MSIEVGNILPGKITGITNFGAFVDLGNRKTGLVHISEVSNSYIKDIKDVLTVGDEVQVKVMEIAGDGKVSLSIRRASSDSSEETIEDKPKFQKSAPRNQEGQGFKKPYSAKSAPSFEKKSPSQAKVNDFDAMMSSFLKDSEDRLTSLKRNTEGKRGGRGGRRS
ncbi:MAG: S1 domain-containing RNA-binding protein [Granulicatella sp.]|uniref:S1 domain-containing RNA-binding protein n=1 Tax=uncultured Granulicatella sp. TaxID=316089 RepID=UPI001CADBDE9|nr:S1 domain-containing RNA-binding protein [uncultured Granulicatella sp.]MBF0993049.1 RNA-binding protein S1 [Granulicatella sp.]